MADAAAIAEDTPPSEQPALPAFAATQQVAPPVFDPHHSGMLITFKETLGALLDVVDKTTPPVLVIGTGVVCLCFARAAPLTGSSLVVILGRRAEPLEPAVELWADAVINASEDDADARANQLTDRRGFDYVIEAVGENNLINLSLRLVARGP